MGRAKLVSFWAWYVRRYVAQHTADLQPVRVDIHAGEQGLQDLSPLLRRCCVCPSHDLRAQPFQGVVVYLDVTDMRKVPLCLLKILLNLLECWKDIGAGDLVL